MSVNINTVIVGGNLVRDPQVRFLSNEKAVANFSLAINNRYKAADGTMKEDVTFVDIEAWGRTAELVGQYLSKGRACLVEGRLKLDSWEKDGVKHSRLRVVADKVQFLDSKRDSTTRTATGEQGGATPPAATGTTAPPPSDDEPPF